MDKVCLCKMNARNFVGQTRCGNSKVQIGYCIVVQSYAKCFDFDIKNFNVKFRKIYERRQVFNNSLFMQPAFIYKRSIAISI